MGKKDVTAKEAHLRQYKTTALWKEHRLTILSYGNDSYILKYQYQISFKKSGTIDLIFFYFQIIFSQFPIIFEIIK